MIGKKIKELRMEVGISQQEVADKLEINRRTLSHYENEALQVPNDLIPKLAKFYGVTIDYLFGLED